MLPEDVEVVVVAGLVWSVVVDELNEPPAEPCFHEPSRDGPSRVIVTYLAKRIPIAPEPCCVSSPLSYSRFLRRLVFERTAPLCAMSPVNEGVEFPYV